MGSCLRVGRLAGWQIGRLDCWIVGFADSETPVDWRAGSLGNGCSWSCTVLYSTYIYVCT